MWRAARPRRRLAAFLSQRRAARAGFTEGLTGPLECATLLCGEGDKVTARPVAVAPEGAGGSSRLLSTEQGDGSRQLRLEQHRR